MTEPRVSGLHRFSSAAAHYLAGRPAYSPHLISRVAQLCGLTKQDHLLDLGCGPGSLAVALAPFVAEVVGVDPEPAMLAAAADHAARAGINIRLVAGSSDDLDPALTGFRMVVIGRAFHWMDRRATLDMLDGRIVADGAVVLFGDRHPDVPDNRWRQPYRDVLAEHAVDQAAESLRKSPDWPSHKAILLDSPFSHLEGISVIERHLTPVETFVERAFSLSSTAPGRLDDQGATLARAIRNLMADYAADGLVREVVETEALIAWRRPPSLR